MFLHIKGLLCEYKNTYGRVNAKTKLSMIQKYLTNAKT